MRHRRRGCPRQRRSHPHRGHPAARIPRLRFVRARGDQRRPASVGQHRARRRSCGAGDVERHQRHDGNLAHALGDARRAHAHQRASARQRRRNRGGAQRHRRELRALARAAAAAGIPLRHPDRHRGDRPPHPLPLRRRPAARGAQGRRRIPRRVRDRRHEHARAGSHRRGARRQPAARGRLATTTISSPRTRARSRPSRSASRIWRKETSPTSGANPMPSTTRTECASRAR